MVRRKAIGATENFEESTGGQGGRVLAAACVLRRVTRGLRKTRTRLRKGSQDLRGAAVEELRRGPERWSFT